MRERHMNVCGFFSSLTRIPCPPDSQTESPYKIGEKGHPRPREESKIPRGDTSRHPIALPSPPPAARPRALRPHLGDLSRKPTPSQLALRDRNPRGPVRPQRRNVRVHLQYHTNASRFAPRPRPRRAAAPWRPRSASAPAAAPPRVSGLGARRRARGGDRRRPRSPSPSRLRRRRWRRRRRCAPPLGVRGEQPQRRRSRTPVPAQRGSRQLPQAGRGAAQGGRIVGRREKRAGGGEAVSAGLRAPRRRRPLSRNCTVYYTRRSFRRHDARARALGLIVAR